MSAIQDSGLLESHLREVIALHFDPRWGTPYWIEKASELGFYPREFIQHVDDIPRLGWMDLDALRRRPLFDFLPKSMTNLRDSLIIAQTGGTLGHPIWTAFSKNEFQAAFVQPFVAAADFVSFPRGCVWLYVGPSGPHIIGRAAEAIARSFGSLPPFSVDLDPRWMGKLVAGSFAAERYLGHVLDQAQAIFDVQSVEVLFSTPPLVRGLAARMSAKQRERIRGVHYGGMALDPLDLLQFQTEFFPNAVHLSGYGNTLFGCCLELNSQPGRALRYYPQGARLIFGIEDAEQVHGGPLYSSMEREGRLVFTRLDRTLLLANVLERDWVKLVCPPEARPEGFEQFGVESPRHIREANLPTTAAIY